MKVVGLGVDYSNICKNYNTAYLDRDNNDPDTTKCMKTVLAWMDQFLADIQNKFGFKIFQLHNSIPLESKEIASKRFLFYSLEKGVTIQNFVLQKDSSGYADLVQWSSQNEDSLLIQNDEEGEGFYIYCDENSKIHQWLQERLSDFTLDEVPFNIKY